jgi:hypothetical protein
MKQKQDGLTPDCRRAVMQFSSQTGMDYWTALQFLLMEGLKAQAGCPPSCPAPDDLTVENHVIKRGIIQG